MRSIVLSFCLVLATLSSFAQETRYRLERILVEGSKVDQDLVRGEARLDEEGSYTERDFQQAVYRIRRLPFVTDAAYRIEPGVTAGGTTLVIQILDTKPVYYGLNVAARSGGEGDTETTGDALLGGRVMLGNLGMIEGSAQKSEAEDGILADMTYRAYNIYGTGGFAFVTASQRFRAEPRRFSPGVLATLGYPLTQRQTVTASIGKGGTRLPREFDVEGDDDDADVDEDEAEDDNETLTDRDRFYSANLRWWYETIDDPIFATRGVQISAGPNWIQSEASVEAYDQTAKKVVSTVTDATSYGFGLDASAFRPLTPRNAVFLRLGGDASRAEETELEVINGSARLGFTHDFHPPAVNAIRPFKARLEIGAGYGGTLIRPKVGEETDITGAFGEAAFVMRHNWGSIRISAFYDAE